MTGAWCIPCVALAACRRYNQLVQVSRQTGVRLIDLQAWNQHLPAILRRGVAYIVYLKNPAKSLPQPLAA